MTGTTIERSYDLTIRLIKKELPKREGAPTGLHEARYYTQYLSKDGFLLQEHITTDEEKYFFNHVRKERDTLV